MAVKGVLFSASGKIARVVTFDIKLHGRKERTKSKRNIKIFPFSYAQSIAQKRRITTSLLPTSNSKD